MAKWGCQFEAEEDFTAEGAEGTEGRSMKGGRDLTTEDTEGTEVRSYGERRGLAARGWEGRERGGDVGFGMPGGVHSERP